MIRVFIGYDNNEKVAFSTLSHSLLKHSTQPIAITPIRLENIKDIFVKWILVKKNIEIINEFNLSPHLESGWFTKIIRSKSFLKREDGQN